MSEKKVPQTEDTQVIKKKPRGGSFSSPILGENALKVEPGDNSRYLQKNMILMNLPDIDLHNIEEVQERIQFFFDYMAQCDSKPTVAGLAMSLNGMDRRTLWAIVNDQPTGGAGYKTALPSEVAYSLKKAYKIMEMLWEDYMQNGKINPVTGIFLGKNNYNYQDKTEHVLTPNTQQDNNYDADDIRKRYLPDSESD